MGCLNMEKQFYKKVLKYLYPYRSKILLLAFLMFIVTIANIYIPLIQKKIIDNGLLVNNFSYLLTLVSIMIGISLVIQGLTFIQSLLQIDIHLNFIRNMEIEIVNHALKLKEKYIWNNGLYKLINDTGHCAGIISQITGDTVLTSLLQVFKFIGVLIGLFIINWKMTLFILISIPLRMFLSNIVSKSINKYSKESIDMQRTLHKWEVDLFLATNEIKLWNLYSIKEKEYKELLNKRDKVTQKLYLTLNLNMMIGDTFQGVILNAIYILCGVLMWRESLTIGGILAFISYANSLMEPIAFISILRGILAEIEPALNSYEEFFALEIEETDQEQNTKKIPILKQDIRISFDNVSFNYHDRELYSDIKFEIMSGEKIALIGENGTGKTTLINLLLRFYEPTSGNIKLNDIDINEFRLNEFRDLFSVITQNPYLFQGTILDNLTVFGENEDDFNMQKENLLSFINKLPKREYTNIGNNSSKISGGEKQKIALYRALLKKSRILIMDEPTANYDVQSEKDFEEIVLNNDKDITIVITHNPQLLKLMNKIILVKNNTVHIFKEYSELIVMEKQYQ